MQKEITDGTLDGDPPGSNDGTILRPIGEIIFRYDDGLSLGS